MTEDRLYHGFPDIVFRSLKNLMLLGMLPSDEVHEILRPYLECRDEVISKIPEGLRADVEDILSLYPEIGEKYGRGWLPEPAAVLNIFWRKWKAGKRGPLITGGEEEGLRAGGYCGAEFASEMQKGWLEDCSWQGIFRTNRDHPVRLTFSYDEENAGMVFRAAGFFGTLGVYVNGVCMLKLTSQVHSEEGFLDMERLSAVLEREDREDLELEIREETDIS